MKIIITGDTHIRSCNKQLPSRLLTECSTSDLIVHTGDFLTPLDLETLRKYADVKAVYGNVDDEDIRALIPERQVCEMNGLKTGLVHGDGKGKTTEQRAVEAFQEDAVDVIIFGHSHIPVIKYFKGILLLNPGSPTDKRKLPFYSFIRLEIEEEIKTELILFKDKE